MENTQSNIEHLTAQFIEHYRKGAYESALTYASEACELARRHYGDTHPEVASSASNLAVVHQKLGNYQEAESLYLEILELDRQFYGKEDLNYATSLNNLAVLYRSMGQYDEAAHRYQDTLEIYRKRLGDNHPDVAAVLNNLGLLYSYMGKVREALPLLADATKIILATLGEEHLLYSKNASNLAATYQADGQYLKAEELYQKILALRRKTLGESHPDFATSLNNLASLWQEMGEYAEAEKFLLQALDIRRNTLGENHPLFATTLDSLAMLYKLMGNYAEAISFCLQAVEIRRETLGEQHTYYASALNTLATLHEAMGHFDDAERYFHQAMEIDRNALGEKHPQFAVRLHNLAQLYDNKRDYENAQKFYEQSLKITRETQGENHSSIIPTLNNLAALSQKTGEYSKAEILYTQAIDMFHSSAGGDDTDFAKSLSNLATLCLWQKRYAQAEPLFHQALNIQREALGEKHPDFSGTLSNFAILETALGKPAKALKTMLEVAAIDDWTIAQVSAVSNEKHIQEYIRTLHQRYYILLSNFSQHYPDLKSYAPRVFDMVLKRKAIALELVAARRDAILAGGHSELENKLLKDKFDELRNLRLAVARLLTEGANDISADLYQKQLRALEQRLEILERELAAQVPQVKLQQKLELVKHETIASLLPEGSRLVEFVWYRPYDFERHIFSTPRYLAFILSDGIEKKIRYLDLGEASEIDGLISHYRKAITAKFEFTERSFNSLQKEQIPANILGSLRALQGQEFVGEEEFLNAVEGRIEEEDTIRYAHLLLKYTDRSRKNKRDISVSPIQKKISKRYIPFSGRMLYEKLFLPLVEKLKSVTHLILSPDGNITLLPFEILPQPNDTYVVEGFDIHYLDSGRDLLRFEYQNEPQTDPLILADPDFDLQGSGSMSNSDVVNVPYTQETLRRDIVAQVKPDLAEQEYENDSHRLKIFPQLSGTKKEADSIHPLFKNHVNVWLGKDALDGKLKAIQGPGLLHCATHGFFLPQEEHDDSGVFLDLETAKAAKDILFQRRNFTNPLVHSGLALAGVHSFLQGKATAKYAEDGLLTALDVTGMDLIGTDLVVLSACVSGLGKMQPGEGVYGLRRAFTLAGARTQVLSLWSVPDEQTQELIVSFYENILQGTEKAAALREAQRKMIEARREERLSDTPYYWGAFVCVGDPGTLYGQSFNAPQSSKTPEPEEKTISEAPEKEPATAPPTEKTKKRWWLFWKA